MLHYGYTVCPLCHQCCMIRSNVILYCQMTPRLVQVNTRHKDHIMSLYAGRRVSHGLWSALFYRQSATARKQASNQLYQGIYRRCTEHYLSVQESYVQCMRRCPQCSFAPLWKGKWWYVFILTFITLSSTLFPPCTPNKNPVVETDVQCTVESSNACRGDTVCLLYHEGCREYVSSTDYRLLMHMYSLIWKRWRSWKLSEVLAKKDTKGSAYDHGNIHSYTVVVASKVLQYLREGTSHRCQGVPVSSRRCQGVLYLSPLDGAKMYCTCLLSTAGQVRWYIRRIVSTICWSVWSGCYSFLSSFSTLDCFYSVCCFATINHITV